MKTVRSLAMLKATNSNTSILVFNMSSEGGLAEHVYYQAKTLEQMGYTVVCLSAPNFLKNRTAGFEIKKVLWEMPSVNMAKPLRRIVQLLSIVFNYYCLAFYIIKLKPGIVLIDSYREYLAPLWSFVIKFALSISKSTAVVNLHDPVRDNEIGPLWWHNWSVKKGFSFVHIALVHAPLPVAAKVPKRIQVVEVPVGVYEMRASTKNRDAIRAAWGAKPDDLVLLSFGFVRDNKNIDLLIEAIARTHQTFLVVAGRSQSSADKPFSFYENLAKQLGVWERCYFLTTL